MTGQRAQPGALPAVVGVLFLFSGAAALVYEVLWFRMLVLRLGGTGLSVATVTAAFMAGLGLGAWLFGTRLALGVRPLRLYGVLEIAIGIYALLVPTLIGAMGRVDLALLGAEPGALGRVVRFMLAGSVLFPAAVCMGATLPVLSRLVEAGGSRPDRFIGFLYGLNTTGAVLGAGATGFLLLPRLGLDHSIHVAVALNLILGVVALVLARPRAETAPHVPVRPEPGGATAEEPGLGLAIVVAFLSGLTSFVLQVSWTRILALVFGSSVYAFSLILVIFLFGLGAGALSGAFFAQRVRRARVGLAWCLVLSGGIALLGQTVYPSLPRLYLEAMISAGGAQSLAGAASLAALLMLPTTFLLGANFPFVVSVATGNRSRGASAGVGRLYAGNTAGCVLGAYTAALLLIPIFGLSGAVSLASLTAMALGAALALPRDARGGNGSWPGRIGPAVAGMVALAAWIVAVPGWNQGLMSLGVGLWGPRAHVFGRDLRTDLATLSSDRILYYRDGVTATVVVKEAGGDKGGPAHRYMSVDGHIEASNGADMPAQVLLAHLPLAAVRASAPEMLIIGYASGVTTGSALTHAATTVTVIDIEEAVVGGSRFFDHVNGRPLENPRARLVVNDARAYLERTDRRFDAISSAPSSVWLSGPAKLFTREFFALARSRLRPGGVLGQWLSTYDLRPDDILTVVRTLRDVFPEVAILRLLEGSDLLLLASDAPIRLDLPALGAWWSNPGIRADLLRVGVRGPCGILDRVLVEPRAVEDAVGPGPLNTDDTALLEYRGARTVGTQGEAEALARLTAEARGAADLVEGLAPAGPGGAGEMAVLCREQGAVRAARSLALRALDGGKDPDALWVLGESSRDDGDREAALRRFREALQANPRHRPSLVSAAFSLQETDRLPEALEAWNRAAEVVPGDPIVPAYRGLVRLYLRDAGAIADFRAARALVTTPPPPIPLDLYEACALQDTGRDLDARPLLEEFLGGTSGRDELQSVAALERLARILARFPAERARAEGLSSQAAAGRGRLIPSVLADAVRIADEGGESGARAFLRDAMALDPALGPAIERGIETLSDPAVGGRIRSILSKIVDGGLP